jgi:hypothetical protein
MARSVAVRALQIYAQRLRNCAKYFTIDKPV